MEIRQISELMRQLNYLPAFSTEQVIFLALSTLLTAGVIYFWMRIFHEAPHPFHAILVGFIANFQNFIIPFFVLYLPIPYIFQIAPIIFWILVIKIFYSELDWKHVFIIVVLSYGTFALLKIIGVAGIIYRMIFV